VEAPSHPRRLAALLAVPLAPLAVFAGVVLVTPWSSWSARAYACGVLAATLGLATAARARRRGVTRAGLAVVAGVAVLRIFTAARGASLQMTTLAGGGARLVGRVVDEQDAAMWGARAAFAIGAFRDPDRDEVPGALREAYAEMRAREGDTPSPVIPTYAGLERGSSVDVVVVERPAARGAFLFLHGFGGSFALPCWQLAEAVASAEMSTYCPSLGPRADWWTPEGERVVRETVRMIRASGVTRIVLAGLSNGAVGAAHLAPRMPGAFAGVVLVSGAARDARAPGVPVLVLQGSRDAIMPAELARGYAEAHGATFVDLDAGHFALLVRRAEATRALRSWLAGLGN
jgi:predicted alpha/beta hydrolase family esterase